MRAGLVLLLGVTMMIFGVFLGLELCRIAVSLFVSVRWDLSPRILKFILLDGIAMFLALLGLAYLLPRRPVA